MPYLRWIAVSMCFLAPLAAATFGTVVAPSGGYLVGGASDIVLDEGRNRLYLVNSSQTRIEIYSIAQRRFLGSIRTSTFPLSAAMSRDGAFLYVTCHDANALNVIDLESQTLIKSVSLPAKPEGVAVGADERVLITTIGTGPNNAANTFLVYDPNASGSTSLANVVIAPRPPMPPQLPPLLGRPALAGRSRLIATQDGSRIIGVNAPANNARAVWVYETASGTVIRSREVSGLSTVLSVSPDGSKFMAGLTLFETESLTVLGQQNAANAPFALSVNTTPQGFNQVASQFNLQQNQGGSVFSPDGSVLYSAFNIAPVQNPPARPNISQLYFNDPENFLIRTAVQLPENAAGKMVITSDGGTIFALSESGFLILPVGNLARFPIAAPETNVTLLANDQCGVTAEQRRSTVAVRNEGAGRLRATATLLQGQQIIPGLGRPGGPGGGPPGGGVVIILPAPIAPVAPGQTTSQAAQQQTAPRARAVNNATASDLIFEFNTAAARSIGTIAPHEFLIQSAEAVNIIPTVRVFQNNRNAEARGEIIPVPTGISPNERLTDIVADPLRNRLYIANSGLNRIEVFDMGERQFLTPITVGQLPRSIALSPEGNELYVANSGSEYISIINLDEGAVTGKIRFPPIPFNANYAVISPSVIAATQRGLQIVMSNGTLWTVVGDQAVPRPLSRLVGNPTVPAPRTMVATPGGEYALLLDGQGYAYLYDSLVDEFVQRRQVVSAPIRGYYGPVGAGPRGNYFLVNGMVLNQSLTPVSSAGTVVLPATRPGATPAQFTRPIAAVAAAGATLFARYAQPVRANQNAVVTEPPVVELVELTTNRVVASAPALEGPLSTLVGNGRVNVVSRTMAVDPDGTTAYLLTTSGLQIVPLDTVAAADRPQISRNGVVNLASNTTALSPGSLAAIYGRNLGAPAKAEGTPLPTVLGGVCVTLNNRPLPLLMTSPEQINVQIPPELAASRFPLVVRSIDRKAATAPQQVALAKYAPAVFLDSETGQAAVFHDDGTPVTKSAPAKRDQRLVIYAAGLGATKGPRITAGVPAPDSPPAVTDPVQVFFGDPRYREAAMDVEWSGLAPGMIGVYHIKIYVPWYRMRGEQPITIRIGNVTSPQSETYKPTVFVD